jgi:hypothetical protein
MSKAKKKPGPVAPEVATVSETVSETVPEQLAPPAGLRLEYLDPATLESNPENWRRHPEAQTKAISAALKEVGWAGALLWNERTKRLIDGHARKEVTAPGVKVPVLIGSWSEEQERVILASLDPLAGMAEADSAALDALLAKVEVDDPDLKAMLDGLKTGEAALPAQPEDENDLFQQEFSILVRCQNEPDQKAILEELDRHGLNLRALVVDYPVAEKKELTAGPELPADGVEIVRNVAIQRSARVCQLEGLFDIPPSKQAEQRWEIKVQLDRPWSIGLIVGPSGSGKSTVARELFGANLVSAWPWSESGAIVDDFPADMPIAAITGLLSSVGFSSPPSWLKPFAVLSNGEQFRVSLARTLAEQPDLAVVDEFTSVVDRTVAQIGSAALAKAVRAGGKKFIAVSCHHDIEEWLQPDWKLEMPAGVLAWRSLRRRPEIQLQIRRVERGKWEIFHHHHYLNNAIGLSSAAQCFMATVNGRPAAFVCAVHYPNAYGGFWRESRAVCLPDFQGVGIGQALSEFVAGMFSCLKSYHSTTSHPAMIRHRLRSPLWRCIRKPSMSGMPKPRANGKARHRVNETNAALRYVASFEYIGPPRLDEAKAFGLLA